MQMNPVKAFQGMDSLPSKCYKYHCTSADLKKTLFLQLLSGIHRMINKLKSNRTLEQSSSMKPDIAPPGVLGRARAPQWEPKILETSMANLKGVVCSQAKFLSSQTASALAAAWHHLTPSISFLTPHINKILQNLIPTTLKYHQVSKDASRAN